MGDDVIARFNQSQYTMLRRCSNTKKISQWNDWRKAHPEKAIQLAGADLERAFLEQADLKGADLRGANLQGADLKGADLRNANLKGALFFEADLKDADLQGAFLWGADLNGVNLEGANLLKTNITRTNFKGAKVAGIRFDSKAALNDIAHPLTEKQIASAVFVDEQAPQGHAESVQGRFQASTWANPCRVTRGILPDATVIARAINFDQENIQAGIGILNYFGEILRQKYEDKKAKVIIEQDGLKVRMAIETGDGEKETIERALEDYVTVVTGRRKMSGYLPKPMAELALKQKMELVNLELKHANVLHSIERAQEKEPFSSPEDSLDRLYRLLSTNICINGK